MKIGRNYYVGYYYAGGPSGYEPEPIGPVGTATIRVSAPLSDGAEGTYTFTVMRNGSPFKNVSVSYDSSGARTSLVVGWSGTDLVDSVSAYAAEWDPPSPWLFGQVTIEEVKAATPTPGPSVEYTVANVSGGSASGISVEIEVGKVPSMYATDWCCAVDTSAETGYITFTPPRRIPPEGTTYPVSITNNNSGGPSGGGPINVCFSVNGGSQICLGEVPPGSDPGNPGTFDVPVLNPGDTIQPIITDPGCVNCDPYYPPPIVWDPYDPNDPWNTGIPNVIYVPPFIPDPDPEPEPEPDPGPGNGNEGNFQGCVSAPCEIPYIYEYRSL